MFERRLDDLIVDASSFLSSGEEAAVLHQTQVFGRHVAGNLARFGEFSDRIFAVEQHLHDPQSHRVAERTQTLRRRLQVFQIDQIEFR